MTTLKRHLSTQIGVIALFSVICSCNGTGSRTTSGTFLALDENIICVNEFDSDVLLKKEEGELVKSHHGTAFRVFGDTLIENLKRDGWGWHVSINNDSICTPMLRQGNGHNEFGSIPNVGYVAFWNESGSLKCRARDFKSGKIYRFKIAAEEDSMQMAQVGELPPNIFNAVCLSDSTAICQILDSSVRQPRKLWQSGEFEDIEFLSTLNGASITDDEDFNILSTCMTYNTTNGMIVEAPIMLNTLLIYDKDCTKGITISYGDAPMAIEDVMDKDNARRLYTFENPRAYDDLAAVLWIGKSKFDFFNIGRDKSSVLFYDYNGHGVAKYSFDFPITHFDFDDANDKLYVRAEDDDEIYSFNIR